VGFFFHQRGKKKKSGWIFWFVLELYYVEVLPKGKKKCLQQAKDKLARILVCFEIV
jgi:hypothetical protein